MSESSATALNEALAGYTQVEALLFETESAGHVHRLTLHLRRSERESAPLRVVFHGVTGLALSEFGGGLTQILCLRAADISERQLDRVGFEVTERERGVLSFRCRSFEVI